MLRDLKAERWPIRWVSDERAHLTLKFYGEVLPSRAAVIAESLQRAVTGAAPMAVRFAELGVFPTMRRPRVLWLGLEAPTSLEILRDRVEREADTIGIAPEGVPFRPHITLGRVREGQRLPVGALEQLAVRPGTDAFMLDEVILFESTLTAAGPQYSARLTLPLTP